MPRIIKSAFARITTAFQFPSDLFSISPGEPQFRPTVRHYLTTEEAWSRDWDRIGEAFRSAAVKVMSDLEAECAAVPISICSDRPRL